MTSSDDYTREGLFDGLLKSIEKKEGSPVIVSEQVRKALIPESRRMGNLLIQNEYADPRLDPRELLHLDSN